MRKKRILIANDASNIGTGYGVYGKELLSRLHKMGKYEIAELSCYISTDNVAPLRSSVPWRVYPNAPSKNDPPEAQRLFNNNVSNAFGAWRFSQVCCHFNPDIVFDMRDPWMYAHEEVNPLRPFYKWVVMPTVDSAPQKEEWLYGFSNMDLVIPYTEWAKETLENQCGSSINLFPEIANAGVDLDTFCPATNKKELQQTIFGKEVEIVGFVMRNQKRKLIPDVFKAYKQYLDRLIAENKTEQYEKSVLLAHTSYPETVGWNIPELLLEYEIIDKVFFSNICMRCKTVSIKKFHQQPAFCQNCNSVGCMMPGAGNSISTQQLVSIYQLFDLFLQVAICEGFGMPQVEAAACGVPIASTNYSAMREIVRNLEGYPIAIASLPKEIETSAYRATIDVASISNIIYDFFQLTEKERDDKSKKTRELCKKYYSWDGVAEVWDRALDSVDISTNIPWDAPIRELDMTHQVPNVLSPMELVKFICDNIIKEPWLADVSSIRNLVRDCSLGYTATRAGTKGLTQEVIVKELEKVAEFKSKMEIIRTNKSADIYKEPYLNE